MFTALSKIQFWSEWLVSLFLHPVQRPKFMSLIHFEDARGEGFCSIRRNGCNYQVSTFWL